MCSHNTYYEHSKNNGRKKFYIIGPWSPGKGAARPADAECLRGCSDPGNGGSPPPAARPDPDETFPSLFRCTNLLSSDKDLPPRPSVSLADFVKHFWKRHLRVGLIS